ncbi:cyclopentanone-monooxygenase [Moniliophthora roreri]|nr:cyclopentanone-monooxygenase [Moniliophthora roreri]
MAERSFLSDEELWKGCNWKEKFPTSNEIIDYFHYVDKKLDLSRDIQFNTQATVAQPEGGVDFRGKRVGVIGTGATGVQVSQEVGPVAGHLTVFQRTPNFALPMNERQVDGAYQKKLKEIYPAYFNRRPQTFGGHQPNVALVDVNESPIDSFTEKGVKTKDGAVYELDILLLATGYGMITGGITQIDIKGTDGVFHWRYMERRVYTYLGMMTANYPNLFFISITFCNDPSCDCRRVTLVHDLSNLGLWGKANPSVLMYASKLQESAEKGYEGLEMGTVGTVALRFSLSGTFVHLPTM